MVVLSDEWGSFAVPVINKVSASVFDKPAKPLGRTPSPEQLELITKLRSIKTDKDAYEILLTGDEKSATLRQQITRAAKAAGVNVAVKKSPHGFYVGLLTPERTSGRGRKPNTLG